MAKRSETWSLAGIALSILFGPSIAVSAAPRTNPVAVGQASAGRLAIDTASLHNHHGHGWQRALATVELADPIADGGRMLTRVDEIRDWDCSGRRYRVLRRIFRTDDGQYVRSEAVRGAWSPVAEGGAERKAFELICPSAIPREGTAAAEFNPVEAEGKRRRSGAAVIWMPGAARHAPENSGGHR